MFSSLRKEDIDKISIQMAQKKVTKTSLTNTLGKDLFNSLFDNNIIIKKSNKFMFSEEAKKTFIDQFGPLPETVEPPTTKKSSKKTTKKESTPKPKKLTAKEKDELLLTLIEKVKELDTRMSNLEKKLGGKESSQGNIETTISTEEFTNHLRKSYDLINIQGRHGGMIPIPKLWKEMNKHGVSWDEFKSELFNLEKKGVIDLQSAGDPSIFTENDKTIQDPIRGYINYVVWRK